MTGARSGLQATVLLLVRLIVGAVFIYASLDKLAEPAAFAQSVANYRLVPLPLLHLFAWLLPILEAVCGVALILGWQRRGAALLIAAMTVMFIIAIAAALIRDLDISCGCFHTAGGHAVGRDLLLRDIALLVAALVPLLAARDPWSLDALRNRSH